MKSATKKDPGCQQNKEFQAIEARDIIRRRQATAENTFAFAVKVIPGILRALLNKLAKQEQWVILGKMNHIWKKWVTLGKKCNTWKNGSPYKNFNLGKMDQSVTLEKWVILSKVGLTLKMGHT